MELNDGIIFLFFIVMILWTIRADFFLLIFVAAAYIYILLIPINFEISVSQESITQIVDSIISRIPVLLITLLPVLIYSFYIKIKKRDCKQDSD